MIVENHVTEPTKLMKAIVYRNYGPPDVLKYEEIETPAAKDNEVLIRVRAASLNPVDWHFMRGTPYIGRIMMGLRKPKFTSLGFDVSGTVEAVGRDVTQFKSGDQVFGGCRGAFAQYVSTTESSLVAKPDNVTFEQAASAPVASLTALQGIRDKGHMKAGQTVLINGASGGVGTFAVQIGKAFGAQVTGVCSTKNVDLVRSIGADEVIDYTQEDFTKRKERYDIIFDCVGNHSLLACRRVLNPKGTYLIIGGPDGRWIGALARPINALVLSPFVSQKMFMFLTKRNQQDLIIVRDLMEDGKVKPVIDKCYSLSEVAEAIRYLEQGHARGKVVVTTADIENIT
jgi:NADPH:quinone reductase-like Zn-dependent oxidoreductase